MKIFLTFVGPIETFYKCGLNDIAQNLSSTNLEINFNTWQMWAFSLYSWDKACTTMFFVVELWILSWIFKCCSIGDLSNEQVFSNDKL